MGGTPAAVRKALQRHGIPQAEDGSFDADRLHALWEAERSEAPSSPPGGTGEPGGGEPGNRPPPPPQGEPTAAGEVVSKAEALRRKEVALARRREYEVELLAGTLVRKDAVAAALFEIARMVRDRIQAIPDRQAEVLAAETDPAAVHGFLTEELDRALSGLADDLVKRAAEASDGEKG